MYYQSWTLSLLLLSLCQGSAAQFGGYGGYGDGGYGGYGGGSSGSSSSDGNGGFSQFEGFAGFDIQKAEAIRLAHGVIACLAFVIFFPFGAIFLRIIPGRFAIVVHVLLQLSAYVLYIIAFGLGIWITTTIKFGGFLNLYNNAHPIIGIVLFVFLFFQPILGAIHHIGFKKHGRRRAASYAHIWLGRILITLGIINGGLGLKFAGNVRRGTYVAYGVVAGIIWLIWLVVAVFAESRRQRNVPTTRRARRHGSRGPSRSSRNSPRRSLSHEDKRAPTYA